MRWWGSSISSEKDKMLYRAIKADKLGSIILWPAGNRKDMPGEVIANTTSAELQINAASAGEKMEGGQPKGYPRNVPEKNDSFRG